MRNYTVNYEVVKYWAFRAAILTTIVITLLFAAEFAAEASHRASGPCDNCSRYSWFARQMCNFDNWINKCRSGH